MAISGDERAFFIAQGKHIAFQPKDAGHRAGGNRPIALGICQQAMKFQSGPLRVPAPLLPVIASTLQTTLDALVTQGSVPQRPHRRGGPQKKIRQQLEQIEALPTAKQRAVAQVRDSMLANKP